MITTTTTNGITTTRQRAALLVDSWSGDSVASARSYPEIVSEILASCDPGATSGIRGHEVYLADHCVSVDSDGDVVCEWTEATDIPTAEEICGMECAVSGMPWWRE